LKIHIQKTVADFNTIIIVGSLFYSCKNFEFDLFVFVKKKRKETKKEATGFYIKQQTPFFNLISYVLT
jgi:hypothetical protein